MSLLRWISALSAGAAVLLLASCGKSNDASRPPLGQTQPAAPAPARLHLLLEAEDLTPVVAPMEVVDDATASKGKCVKIPAGLSKEAPHTGKIEATVDVPAPAKIYFWYRVLWNGTCSNSVTVKVGNSPEFIVGEDGTYKAWHWVKSPALDLPAGPVQLVIGQREEDIGVDQILITADADYVPVDIE